MIEHPVVDIELVVPYGSILVILPAGATADINGITTEWGKLHSKVDEVGAHGSLHVRISGEVGYVRLKVRHTRR